MLLLLLASMHQAMTEGEAARMARAALVGALGQHAERASVRRVEKTEWRSSALGCPEKGRRYDDTATSGFRVIFELDDQRFRVHVGDGRAILCGWNLAATGGAEKGNRATKEPEPTIPEPEDPALRRLVERARKNLAARLSIDADTIELLEVESVVWSDGSLGCAQPGRVYTQALVDGIRIRLRVGKRIYHYHGGGRREPFLCENPP